jgi:predicted GIY-YIG superfamily endonuclease
MKGVYLLHFSSGLKHAHHYIGWSNDIDKRIQHHRDGSGARICAVAVAAGIELIKARVWEGKERDFERQLKRYHKSTLLCPICSAGAEKRMKQ